jgi:hypothetical protein
MPFVGSSLKPLIKENNSCFVLFCFPSKKLDFSNSNIYGVGVPTMDLYKHGGPLQSGQDVCIILSSIGSEVRGCV